MNWLFVKRMRSLVLLAALASLVLNVALLMPAIYMMQVFDRVFASRSVETLVMLGAVTLLFLALAFALDTVRVRTLAWAGRSLEGKLASSAIRGSLEQAASVPGGADADALRDISQLRGYLSGPGVLALFDAPWLPIYLLIIALMHPALGMAAGIGACVLVALCALTHRLTRAQSEQALGRSRASARLAERLMRNAEVIVAMGMSTTAVGRWSDQHERLLTAQERQVRASSLLGALARSLRQVLQVIMLGLGAWLVVEQKASAGVMIAATVLLSRALQPVEYLISGWRVTLDARGAWRRLSDRVTGERSISSVALPAPTGRIEVERLTYAAAPSRPPILRNVSLTLAAGESLGVIGASACGKTTLMRLMLGLWRPQAGLVRLDGADVARWDRDTLGRYIGYLPQDVELLAGTVGENIARFTDTAGTAHSSSIVRAAELAHAHELILQLPDGYDTQIGEGGAALSGGQRQRIALARALYGNPRFVVLDEPDASLDTVGAAALLLALARLKSRGVTVVVVSHNTALMTAVDKLAYLRNGVLEMFGPSAAVLNRLRAVTSPSHGAETAALGSASPQRVVAFPSSCGATRSSSQPGPGETGALA